jgi:hypothetical protein
MAGCTLIVQWTGANRGEQGRKLYPCFRYIFKQEQTVTNKRENQKGRGE